MYRYTKALAIALVLATTAACSNKAKQETAFSLWVNSTKVPCEGVAPMQCLQVQRGNNDPAVEKWEYFYSSIEGFNFEPGYIYQLSVIERQLEPENTPADAPSSSYHLVKVIQKKVPAELPLNDIWALQQLAGAEIEIPDDGLSQRPTLEINVAERRFNGNDSCNQIFGTIDTLDTQAIIFGNAASTKMACPEMALADRFHNALETVRGYRIKGLELHLQDESGNTQLVFKKVD
ncbi:DUF4377 domain-containing protein [bacterium SCSIO 12696]|nr:DUF4377 domain-containing protein [bacterium SCSIO 12696]